MSKKQDATITTTKTSESTEVTKVKSFLGVVTYVVEKPQSLAVIFALVMLGMFLGVVPSTFLESQQEMAVTLNMMSTDHKAILANQEAARIRADDRQNVIIKVIETNNVSTAAQTKELIQIMRGMCLIIAKQNINDTALCNP